MKTHGHTILITGGSAGIGLGLASRFLRQNNKVIVCGRDSGKLEEARRRYPGLQTVTCDVGQPAQRQSLVEKITRDFPDLNVLVNNAGIQRRVGLLQNEPWEETAAELAINLEAPVHLSRLMIPFLQKQAHPAIINVTSGLSFAPIASMPLYCASKAALHSFTLSLRHALRQTGIEVIEIIPPAVNTDLGGKGLHDFGVPLDEFCDAMFQGLAEGRQEIAYGSSIKSSRASREELDAIFQGMNR